MDCSLPGSSVHGILQARILEWVAIPFSKGSSWLGDWTCVSYVAGRFFRVSTREASQTAQWWKVCLPLIESPAEGARLCCCPVHRPKCPRWAGAGVSRAMILHHPESASHLPSRTASAWGPCCAEASCSIVQCFCTFEMIIKMSVSPNLFSNIKSNFPT